MKNITTNLWTKMRTAFIAVGLIFIGLLLPATDEAQCTTVDQSQLNYNGGMSARNLPQYTVWQDFTSGSTGTLCKIDVGFFNAMTGVGTLNIFAGSGTAGSLLQTQTVTVSGTGNFFQTFNVSAPVNAGGVYTFQFIPVQGGGLPDPYGLQIQSPGSYTGGQLEITDPSGTSVTGMDMVFKTYVDISIGVSEIENKESISILFPNPFNDVTLLKTDVRCVNATLIIRNILGQEVKIINNVSGNEINIYRDNLETGMYTVTLIENNKIITNNKLVIVDK